MMADPVFDTTASTAEIGAHYLGGSPEAETELLARAGAGELEAQRFFLTAATAAFLAEDEGQESYLAAAEVFGRLAAARGAGEDRRRLASLLSLQASHSRTMMRTEFAIGCETECLLILNRLADEGDEDAAKAVGAFAEEFSEEAVKAAALSAKQDRATVVCVAPPPPAVEPWTLDWTNPLKPFSPPTTRWGRLRLWLENRAWDTRFYFEGLWYALCLLGRSVVGR